jgi:hypothetical protein
VLFPVQKEEISQNNKQQITIYTIYCKLTQIHNTRTQILKRKRTENKSKFQAMDMKVLR